MLRKKIQFWRSVLFFLDCALLAGCWVLAYRLRFDSGLIPLRYDVPPFEGYLDALWLLPPVWLLVFAGLRLHRTRRRGSRTGEVLRLAKASGLFTLVLVSASWLVFKLNFSRVFLACFWSMSCVGLVGLRVAFREGIRILRRHGLTSRAALIVGTNELAQDVHAKLKEHPELGLRLRGFVSTSEAEVGQEVGEVPVIGTLAELKTIVRRERIDEVFVAQAAEVNLALDHVLSELSEELVDVNLVSDLYKHALLGGRIEDFEGMPLLAVTSSPMIGWGYVAKRLFDVSLSTLGLLVSTPIVLVSALLVRLTSPGPAFYRQERFGLDGRRFTIYKIRTMRIDAEKDGPVWGKKDDPRVTPLGRLLRLFSIDELPQLLNVLRGDMSLVGPRPAQPVFVDRFRESIPRYMLRHRVKPGLTGWAQIHGQRGDAPPDERLQYDLFYIRNWSVALDLKILWRTIWGGFLNRNA